MCLFYHTLGMSALACYAHLLAYLAAACRSPFGALRGPTGLLRDSSHISTLLPDSTK